MAWFMPVSIRLGEEIIRTGLKAFTIAYAAKAKLFEGTEVPSSMKSAILLANRLTPLTVSLAFIFDTLLRLVSLSACGF
jgi:hypothetical protein